MKRIKVVAAKHIPARLPVTGTIAWFLLLDRFHVPPVAWGVFWTLEFLFWAICIVGICVQESIDPFERRG